MDQRRASIQPPWLTTSAPPDQPDARASSATNVSPPAGA